MLIRSDTEDFASASFSTRELARLRLTLALAALATSDDAEWDECDSSELHKALLAAHEWIRDVHDQAMRLDDYESPLDLGRL